jgi:hypothetical protein
MGDGGFKSWALEHKLTVIFGMITAVIAAAAVIVPAVTSGSGGNLATVGTNNGQINQGSNVVNNYYGPSGAPALSQPSASPSSSFCPDIDPATANSIGEVVQLYAKPANDPDACWSTQLDLARTPTDVKFMIRYVNVSKTTAENVVARANLAPGEALLPGTTYLYNTSHPTGVFISGDAVASDGFIVGDYASGAAFYVTFEVETSAPAALSCGTTTITTVGIAHPKSQNEFYNTMTYKLTKQCSSASPSTG